MEFNPEHIVTLKKVRGVVFGVGTSDEKSTLNWLSTNFKYGTLGIPPSLWNTIHPRGSIIPLKWQFKEYELLCEELSRKARIEISIIESIAMASVLCCGIIVVSQKSAEKFTPLTLYTFLGASPSDERSIKSNLKACEESILSFYSQNIDETKLVFSGSVEIGRVTRQRRSKSRQDAQKRFWRIGDGSTGQPIVLYLDLLGPAIQHLEKANLFIPALSIVPALVIDKVTQIESTNRKQEVHRTKG